LEPSSSTDQRIGEIITALNVLEQDLLIGRPVVNGKREAVARNRQRMLNPAAQGTAQ
jgi:hypothetical protein